MCTITSGCILASDAARWPSLHSHASINVTPRALHLKIDDNNLLHLPEGGVANQLGSQPVSQASSQANKLSWQTVGSNCPWQRWRSSWTRRDARCRFSTQFIQSVAVFGALHLLLTGSRQHAPPSCTLQPAKAKRNQRNTKIKHKFRHFVASRFVYPNCNRV